MTASESATQLEAPLVLLAAECDGRTAEAWEPIAENYRIWRHSPGAGRVELAVTASQTVGYESPTQFSREYSRLFGAPPKRDVSRVRAMQEATAGA